jgi:predicted SAM-dependent methyltransferase
MDPLDGSRFVRKEPIRSVSGEAEDALESILRLTDGIFDHLSVFGQFAETTARGAIAGNTAAIDVASAAERLRRAEEELWEAYCGLRRKRAAYVSKQMQSGPANTTGLKLHIGSANCLIEDWINIDAGGADLALNVNWGLPFSDGSVDFIYSSHMLEHLRYSDQAPVFVRELHRVLRKDGIARLVVPDLRKLLTAYVAKDREFFSARQRFYPISDGFMHEGVATLDYILLYCGVGPHTLNYNHKFGYDADTLCKLLCQAGFANARESAFQESASVELRVDNCSFDARAELNDGQHFSLFVEAVK